jgi:hypothetical protein
MNPEELKQIKLACPKIVDLCDNPRHAKMVSSMPPWLVAFLPTLLSILQSFITGGVKAINLTPAQKAELVTTLPKLQEMLSGNVKALPSWLVSLFPLIIQIVDDIINGLNPPPSPAGK